MTPTAGQHVKCLMKNNTIAEGIVEEWHGNYVKLKALDGKSYLIIHHPGEDIMLTKVMVDENSEEKSLAQQVKEKIEAKGTKPRPTEPQLTLEEAFQQLSTEDDTIDMQALDAKSKAQLQVELAKQEREIIAAKLRDHTIEGPKKVQYGYPGLYTKPRTK
jgi:hypothetical protein